MATLLGTAGADTLTGDVENDLIVGSTGADSLVGGDGDDTIIGDHTYSGAGIDLSVPLGFSAPSADTINAGGGNDWIIATIGDVVDGGSGNDTVDIDASLTTLAVSLNLSTANIATAAATAFGGSYTNVETVRFWLGGGNDTFVGSDGNDFVQGGGGVDSLSGGAGNDTLYSGSTSFSGETLLGGDGDDVLYVGSLTQITQSGVTSVSPNFLTVPSLLDGGAGNDVVTTTRFGGTAIGGSGEDTLVLFDQSPGSGTNLNLSVGDANAAVSSQLGISASGFERFSLSTSSGADSLIGSAMQTR
jgi:Ca2+-binding RTX toxin-like protein